MSVCPLGWLQSKTPGTNTILVEFGTETLNFADLDAFFRAYDSSQVGKRPTFVGIDGGMHSPLNVRFRTHLISESAVSNQSITDVNLLLESNLDFQYAMGLLGGSANILQYQVTNSGASQTVRFACTAKSLFGASLTPTGGPSFPYLQYDLLLNALDADYCSFQGGNPPQLSQYTPSNGNRNIPSLPAVAHDGLIT